MSCWVEFQFQITNHFAFRCKVSPNFFRDIGFLRMIIVVVFRDNQMFVSGQNPSLYVVVVVFNPPSLCWIWFLAHFRRARRPRMNEVWRSPGFFYQCVGGVLDLSGGQSWSVRDESATGLDFTFARHVIFSSIGWKVLVKCSFSGFSLSHFRRTDNALVFLFSRIPS